MSFLLTAREIVTGDAVLTPGWVEIEGERIAGIGTGPPPRLLDAERGDLALGDVTLVPGFVDMHTHGGGGGSWYEATPTAVEAALAAHRRRGTTTTVASLLTDRPDALAEQVAYLADHVRAGTLAGVHLEGPWLAAERAGAHEPTALRDPDPAEIDRLLTLAGGTIRMVTLAPERRGGQSAVRRFTDAGVTVAIGHTDADYAQVRAAVAAGARVATHLFNAMRPVHHREPGPAVALCEDPRVTVELIHDGVHIHPALYRAVTHQVGPDRVALVTDAMAAAAMPDGSYRLGLAGVDVVGGVARVAGTDIIAGSTATMDLLFRGAVEHSVGTRPEALLTAVRQTSANPARALGLPDPRLRPGARADLVVLGSDLTVTGVLRAGTWELGTRPDTTSVNRAPSGSSAPPT